MEDDRLKYPIRRKPIPYQQASRLTQRRRPHPAPSPLLAEEQKYLSQREAERNIGQNISLIAKKQEGSFISNRQDHSLDSFDKMIIGVDEELDIEDHNASNSKDHQPNYTLLYSEFERLVKHRDSAEASREEAESNSNILREEAGNSSILRGEFSQGEQALKGLNDGSMKILEDGSIKVLKDRIQQVKDLRRQRGQTANDPNTSLRLLGANLSEIHEEEIPHSSMNRMDPIEQEFIDFVGQNEAGRVNISNIEKLNPQAQLPPSSALKNEFSVSIKEAEEDEVVAMLENELGSRRDNLQQESIEENKKQSSHRAQKENYPQILRELDQNQDKKDNSHLNLSGLLSRRQEWINARADRSARWKAKELQLIAKIKEILFNPYVEFSDDEDFNLSL